jgi:hypothetical protein
MSLTLVITFSLGLLVGIVGFAAGIFHSDSSKFVLLIPALIAGSGGIICITCIKKDKGPVTTDEREKLIEKNAHIAGFGAVYLYVILMSFLPIGIMGEKASIPVTWCPGLLIGAIYFQVYAQSIAILIQYGWSGKGEKV